MIEIKIVRDLYQEMEDGNFKGKIEPFEFAEFEFPKDVFCGLTGSDKDNKPYPLQDIDNMLNMVNDLGDYSKEEWKLFFERVREEGIPIYTNNKKQEVIDAGSQRSVSRNARW